MPQRFSTLKLTGRPSKVIRLYQGLQGSRYIRDRERYKG